jgi:hypothetical protein
MEVFALGANKEELIARFKSATREGIYIYETFGEVIVSQQIF